MATSSSSSLPLPLQLEWYKIRDTLFGHNYVAQNIPLELQLASSCDHPEARWLTSVCAGKDVKTEEEAEQVFFSLGQNDARALCFAWMFGDRWDDDRFSLLRRSAELGYAFAQAEMADETEGEERFKFAQLAASQGERGGFYWLGCCFRDGQGCEKDLEKAKENFLLASNLGDIFAMVELGELLDESDSQRWRWWGLAAARRNSYCFLRGFSKQVALFNSGSGSALVMFAIGRALRGHVNEEAGAIFNGNWNFDARIEPAKQAIAFYEGQLVSYRKAVDTWTEVGMRLKVVKDIRIVIGKLIWETREEALYDTQQMLTAEVVGSEPL